MPSSRTSIPIASSSTAHSIRATATRGLEHLHELAEKYKIKGVKLYTAEWKGDSKGYKLTDKGQLSLPGGSAEARHQEHPRAQGPDDHPA